MLGLAAGCTDQGSPRQAQSPDAAPVVPEGPPNFLLIVADDLAFTDLGAFGGEISTPTLDRLAYEGIRFTNFHTSASCAPTRAMLLTGTDNHLAGMGSQSGLETEQQRLHRAYQNRLLPDVQTLPEALAKLGYVSYASAKWHLGKVEESLPNARGFARSTVLLEGGAGHFDDTPLFQWYGETASWLEDDQPITLPEDFYSTVFMTDQLISYIEATPKDQPYFAYLGYTAPHWPLQAYEEDIERYADTYQSGWDTLRAARFAGAQAKGVVAADAQPVDFEAGMVPWDTLSAAEQAVAAKKMAVYSAMVDRLDREVDRLLQFLEQRGDLANTYIVFMADNGAEAHLMENVANRDGWLDAEFDNSLQNIGKADSYVTLGPGWARAGAVPFRASKSKVSEGGIRVPAFVKRPGVQDARVDDSYARVMDLAPTFIALAGGEVPEEMMGRDLAATLDGRGSSYAPDEVIAYEV